MIHAERPSEPAFFRGPVLERHRKRLRAFFESDEGREGQTRFAFFLPGKDAKILRALRKAFADKCAYCEQTVEAPGYYNVDSFRPKMEALNLDGRSSPLHYWWLAYEWNNLYFACAVCNRLKGSRFPVLGERVAVGADPATERALLLDPCSDRPEEVLLYDENGSVASDDERGRATIEILGLNRRDLVAARKAEYRRVRGDWTRVAKSLRSKVPSISSLMELTDSRRPFAAMRRQWAQAWGRELRSQHPETSRHLRAIDLLPTALPHRTTSESKSKSEVARVVSDFSKAKSAQESFSVEDDSRKRDYYISSQLIERIEIRNFRALKNVQIDVPLHTADRGSWLLLLGENGTGKSSVLQAVALALAGPTARNRIARNSKPASYLRSGCTSGYVRVFLTGHSQPVELQLRRTSPYWRCSETGPKVLLLGYGPTRLLPRSGTRTVSNSGASRVENLFDPFCALSDGVPWLYELDRADFNRIARSLKELLPDGGRFQLRTKSRPKRHIVASDKDGSYPLPELSAGYRSVISLAMDIMSVLRLRWDAMESAEGIVLVDELDAHLHPQWKMQIVSKLRAAFPRLQFLVTSHEPLTLRGLHQGEVGVMRRSPEGDITVLTDLPSPAEFRIDQLLTSDFFGLNSTVDPEEEKRFDEYYALLALKKPNAAQRSRVDELRTELESRRHFGSTLREDLMYTAIDRLVADHRLERSRSVQELKTEAVAEISKIWSEP